MNNIIRLFLKLTVQTVFAVFVLVFTGCDKEVSSSPVEPPPPQGFIYINSLPDGFLIYQDGRNTGRVTPDSISYIKAGDYEITLRKKYFKDTSLVVSLNENQKFILVVDFISNPATYGNLFLQTEPEGAEILINDSSLNKVTPQTIENLFPGEYQIKFRLFNHRETEITAIVQSSRTNNYVEELRDTSEWVDYMISNSGIQSNLLTDIIVDNMNNKWFGTLNEGLIKYDEKVFTNYNTINSSIPANKINCINIDNQNRIWIGTDNGIGILSGSNWTIYNAGNSELTSEIINTIRFDNSGNAWIGTAGNLVKFNGSIWYIYDEPAGKDWINAIYIENESKLWLGTKADGIRTFENSAFDSLLQPVYGYPSNTISSIAADQFSKIWFCFLPDTAGRGGVSSWDGSAFTNFLLGTFDNNVNDIFIDAEDNKWISTSEGFVLFDSQNNSTEFNTLNSVITSNNVRASVRDHNGYVWITTMGGGLNKYKPQL